MKSYYIKENNLNNLLFSLTSDFNVFVPKKVNDDYRYKILKSEKEDIVFAKYRPADPLKGFLFRPIEEIASYFKESDQDNNPTKEQNIIFGLKACDLTALQFTDYVFLEQDQFKDHVYSKTRQNTLIISSDCIDYKEVCFCTQIDGAPYPRKYYDINIAPIGDGYIVEFASEKAEVILNKYPDYFSQATEKLLEELDIRRNSITEDLRKKYDKKENRIPAIEELKGLVKDNPDAKIWNEKVKTCVECGACNMACPTCHCFYLSDIVKGAEYKRYRIWDACQYKNFAKEATGANPRPHLVNRLRNRYVKKFNYFKDILDVYACTGCGRCIEACIGKIDMREVLRNLK